MLNRIQDSKNVNKENNIVNLSQLVKTVDLNLCVVISRDTFFFYLGALAHAIQEWK